LVKSDGSLTHLHRHFSLHQTTVDFQLELFLDCQMKNFPIVFGTGTNGSIPTNLLVSFKVSKLKFRCLHSQTLQSSIFRSSSIPFVVMDISYSESCPKSGDIGKVFRSKGSPSALAESFSSKPTKNLGNLPISPLVIIPCRLKWNFHASGIQYVHLRLHFRSRRIRR